MRVAVAGAVHFGFSIAWVRACNLRPTYGGRGVVRIGRHQAAQLNDAWRGSSPRVGQSLRVRGRRDTSHRRLAPRTTGGSPCTTSSATAGHLQRQTSISSLRGQKPVCAQPPHVVLRARPPLYGCRRPVATVVEVPEERDGW